MRPFDVRLRFIILNIDFTEFIFTILEFIIIVSLAPVNFLEPMVILGVLIVFLSNIILALIRLTLSYLAFLLGKVDAISELADSLNLFNKYPLENINIVLSMLFRTILPFYFFSTLSSRIVNKMMTAGEIRVSLVALSISIIIWVLIHNSVWEWGLRKYENTGG